MDFVRDTLSSGSVFRGFTIVDDFTRECPAIEVDHSLPGERVANALDGISLERGLPKAIICDNGPEFIGQAVDFWAYRNGVSLSFIDPGKPVQNAYVESFNGKFLDRLHRRPRDEVLDAAQALIGRRAQ
jgi:putative transposase